MNVRVRCAGCNAKFVAAVVEGQSSVVCPKCQARIAVDPTEAAAPRTPAPDPRPGRGPRPKPRPQGAAPQGSGSRRTPRPPAVPPPPSPGPPPLPPTGSSAPPPLPREPLAANPGPPPVRSAGPPPVPPTGPPPVPAQVPARVGGRGRTLGMPIVVGVLVGLVGAGILYASSRPKVDEKGEEVRSHSFDPNDFDATSAWAGELSRELGILADGPNKAKHERVVEIVNSRLGAIGQARVDWILPLKEVTTEVARVSEPGSSGWSRTSSGSPTVHVLFGDGETSPPDVVKQARFDREDRFVMRVGTHIDRKTALALSERVRVKGEVRGVLVDAERNIVCVVLTNAIGSKP